MCSGSNACVSTQNEIYSGSCNWGGRGKWNEMKTVMEVPTEWICKESSNFKEISVKSIKWIDMCLEEQTEIVSTMEVTKEMDSAINIATEVKTVKEVANEMKV